MDLVECPWCDERMLVDPDDAGSATCLSCSIVVAFAADPVSSPLASLPLAA